MRPSIVRISIQRPVAPLPAPDVVIQGDMHLITALLGTMAGLYEAAARGGIPSARTVVRSPIGNGTRATGVGRPV